MPVDPNRWTAERLAQLIVESIERHGLRGLIYDAGSTAEEVVMHGKVNMLAVAEEVLAALGPNAAP